MMLHGATIVLTGGTGGIGAAIAQQLSERGAKLVLIGRSADRLEMLTKNLPGVHRVIVADITTASGRAVVEAALVQYGARLDALINCAGISAFGRLMQTSAAEIEALLATNVTAPILLTQLCLPHLNPNSGRVLNVGSTFGGIGYPGFTSYCASKFALRGFTEALRRELRGSALQVAYLAPRATQTPLNSKAVVAMNADLGTAMDPPARVAAVALEMLSSSRMRDRAIGWPERLFLFINALLPRVVDNALGKQLPVITKHADQHRKEPASA